MPKVRRTAVCTVGRRPFSDGGDEPPSPDRSVGGSSRNRTEIVSIIVGLIVVLLIVIVALLLAFALAMLWYRRGQRRIASTFGDAALFIRRRGGDPRLTRRLAALAEDPRTPAAACRWLDRLVRYRHEPIVLAPEWVPVLGWLDEVTVESFMLRQAWRALPPALWDEYVPGARPRTLEPPPATANGEAAPATLRGLLAELDRSGRHAELLRSLERRLPDWPVSATLTEVAAEVLELEQNVESARARGVPDAVTDRLAGEARLAANALWDLADRLAATASFGVSSDRLDGRLANEVDRLRELRTAIQEARTGLAELVLGGAERQSLERAERRFRALARTADELQDLER